ncbi:hypothetical protein [Paenibacillus sp. WLX2291]|uniref:hypothetical protein n=1 Tax=Paenibacillus sp. WLX2291 TaxID=3296934 RepID=UPI0039842DC5
MNHDMRPWEVEELEIEDSQTSEDQYAQNDRVHSIDPLFCFFCWAWGVSDDEDEWGGGDHLPF